MDPNTALENLRTLVAKLEQGLESDPSVFDDADVAELVDTFYGLDQWISKGGFLPRQWTRNR